MLISIFTATYNRKYTLPRLYKSLCNQKTMNFEWIVIDDGSTDGTEDLINGYKRDCLFPIKYYKQSRGGKHRALSFAAMKAEGELFFPVDSDDYLVELATQWIEESWRKRTHDVLGVCFRRIDPRSNMLIGKKFPGSYATPLKINFFWNIRCDKAEVFKTERVKKFPFPEFEGEKFCTEAYWIYLLSSPQNGCGEFLCDNRGIRYTEYLDDGLTKNAKKVMERNPRGYIAYYKLLLTKPIYYLHPKHVLYAWYTLIKLNILLIQKNEKNNIGRA